MRRRRKEKGYRGGGRRREGGRAYDKCTRTFPLLLPQHKQSKKQEAGMALT